PIDGEAGDAGAQQQQQQLLQRHAKTVRRIHLVALDQNELGCQLALTKHGLMVTGFPPSSRAGKEMERRGVREGDLLHAINGATVLLLTPAQAEAVAQRQERPLYLTVGTSNEALLNRPLGRERLAEARRMLLRP